MSGLDELRAMLETYEAAPRRVIPDENYSRLAAASVNALPALLAVVDAAEEMFAADDASGTINALDGDLPELLAFRAAVDAVKGQA